MAAKTESVSTNDTVSDIITDGINALITAAEASLNSPIKLNLKSVEIETPSEPSVPAEPKINPIHLGIGLCPDDEIESKRIEEAFTVLRTGEGFRHIAQNTVYGVLMRYLVRKEQAIVNDFLNNLLEYIHHNREIHFTPITAYLGIEVLSAEKKLTAVQITEFNTILRVLMDAANPSSRLAVVKRIVWDNIRNSLSPNNGDTIHTKLKKFFNIN